MVKIFHEIRDPVLGFVKVHNDERAILDSRFLQRLRDIHQLGLSFLVYPGATHKRFEHSLGVMELASRIYTTITSAENTVQPNHIFQKVKEQIPELNDKDKLQYWHRVLRIAALVHDIGHLPFSHAVEEEIFPPEWNHERMTAELIKSEEFSKIVKQMRPAIELNDVLKLAISPVKLKRIELQTQYSAWEAILSEIISGDALGADRIDYLLRDSHHAGVAYGRFDMIRLVDTIRILPDPSIGEPKLGVEEGGLHSAEALLLARYFMFSQVYYHPIRRAYDLHLTDFIKEWLKEQGWEHWTTNIQKFLDISDSIIINEIFTRARNGHIQAKIITERKHFKVLYQRLSDDVEKNPNIVEDIGREAQKEFGEENIKIDAEKSQETISELSFDFPVLTRTGEVVSSLKQSKVLRYIPPATRGYVFINRNLEKKGFEWLEKIKKDLLELKPKE